MVFFNGFPFSYRHTSKRWHRFAHYFRHCYRTGFTLSTFLAPSLLKQIVRPDVQYRPGNKHSGRMQFTVQLFSGGELAKVCTANFSKVATHFPTLGADCNYTARHDTATSALLLRWQSSESGASCSQSWVDLPSGRCVVMSLWKQICVSSDNYDSVRFGLCEFC